MPRSKELKINTSGLSCYSQLIAELNKNPLLTNYDLSTIELKVKHNKPKPTLKKDVGELINNLLRYQSANRERIPTLDGMQLINKKLLARMLKITRATLDSWIKKGFIQPSHITDIKGDFFQVDKVTSHPRHDDTHRYRRAKKGKSGAGGRQKEVPQEIDRHRPSMCR